MMRVLWGGLGLFLAVLLTGCAGQSVAPQEANADELVHDMEQFWRKKNRCEVETTDFRPDAATKSYYRCTGGNCKDHGCYAH